MAARPDHYKALGVDKKASPEEIKKAYRSLVRKFHPDRNPGDAKAEERFKEISQANDVLSDTEKRAEYDRGAGGFGPGGFGGFDTGAFGGGGGGGAGFGDILSNLFGGGGGGGAGPGRGQPRAQPGRDLETDVRITFDQAVEGAQIPLAVPMSAVCATCRGSGAKPGTSPKICPHCQGRGVEAQGQGLFSISQPCPVCHGAGTVVEDPCPMCSGSGAVRTVKNMRVNIPAGVRDGSRIRLAGKGEAGARGGQPGDLYVITRVAESPVFRRKGENIEVEVPLSVTEALRGATVEVPTLNGRKKLRVAPGTSHGTVQRLRGEGPPRLKGKGKGDIHYRFVIDVPDKLSTEQEKAVDALADVMNGDPRAALFQGAGVRGSGDDGGAAK